ncbi:LysE family translocator [Flexivirga caeni]|uniref:LysE family translocator n=1 Tax=Flexivirga caeni TaxID=2294115 RepID=A0A3M9M448_9MICO|nr:LysE family translocator [Flexivirga caeni]RNI20341.1 LysE family translocator [Flexivirga caeni]
MIQMLAVLPLLAAWLVAVASPGPDFLAVLRTSASHGRRAGLRVGCGVVCGIACWATLAMCGLSALLARYEHLYLVVRTFGALLLIGYGVHILWSTRKAAAEAVPEPPRAGKYWRLGVFTNLANPKALVFFGALFATLMPRHEGVAVRAGVLGVMLIMAMTWFAVVSWCAGSRPVVTAYRRVQRTIDRAAGGLFAAIGVALIPR